MKFRTGFVTNSSSSNYTVYVKDISIDEDTLNRYPVIQRLYDFMVELFKDGDPIRTVEQLNASYLERYGWYETPTIEILFEHEDYLVDEYNRELELLKAGYVILHKSIEYGTSEYGDTLLSLSDGENIIVKYVG